MTKTITEQFCELGRKVLADGVETTGRNGKVKKLWSPPPLIVQDIVEQGFPILNNRPVSFYTAALETLFFMSGRSLYEDMPEKLRNSWWKPWAEAAELAGEWRGFYGSALRSGCRGFDPLHHLLEQMKQVLKTGVENRKMVLSLWNVDLRPVLEACHSTALVFNLEANPLDRQNWRLDLHHTQRSLDLACGTGPDLVYSGLLLKLICDYLMEEFPDLCVQPRTLIYNPVNVHLYDKHWEAFANSLSAYEQAKAPEFITAVALRENTLRNAMSGQYPQTIEEVKKTVYLRYYRPYPDSTKFELIG